jgi:hypothetical protein
MFVGDHVIIKKEDPVCGCVIEPSVSRKACSSVIPVMDDIDEVVAKNIQAALVDLLGEPLDGFHMIFLGIEKKNCQRPAKIERT